MDGNRRFASKNQLEVTRGHTLGFEKLKEILELCLELGVTTVSVYAFSIENFKRPKKEVDGLMNLAKEKLTELGKSDILIKHQVSVRVLGDISMLPQDLQVSVAKLVLDTKDHNNAILNVCVAYTSRNEMLHSVRTLAEGIEDQSIKVDDITEELFEQCLYTDSVPDVLVRTSGETRLSDFMLWQSSFSSVAFFSVLWPELSSWHLFLIVLLYQQHYQQLKKARETYTIHKSQRSGLNNEGVQRAQSFLTMNQKKRHLQLQDILQQSTQQ